MTSTAPTSGLDRKSDRTTDTGELLAIKDLNVRFVLPDRTVYAVNGIDISVATGEVFALVGESGSGKSVSMLSVMGLVPSPPGVVSGSIRFMGRELTDLNRREMNKIRGSEIGMIFQDPMSSLNRFTRLAVRSPRRCDSTATCHGRQPWIGPSTCWTGSAYQTLAAGSATTPTSSPGGCGKGS